MLHPMGKFLVFETKSSFYFSMESRADQPNTIKLTRIERGIITALISTRGKTCNYFSYFNPGRTISQSRLAP